MSLPWLDVPRLEPARMRAVRRRAMFECCKWDAQVEDRSALCDVPIVLSESAWHELARLAQALARELAAAEDELLSRPDLLRRLGLPSALLRLWERMAHDQRPAELARVVRFDFHWTSAGWRISEANTDVPGGFIEAAGFCALMGEQYPHYGPAPDPIEAYARALERRVGKRAQLALIHATAYSDDRQVMEYLARRFAARGLRCQLAAPDDLEWRAGGAWLAREGVCEPLDAILRFYPAEWLPNLGRASGWAQLARGSTTPLSNPATALITQSKRFPLLWNELDTLLDTWRELLPETRDPREAAWRRDPAWVLKPALGRVGDGVALQGITEPKLHKAARRDAWLHPGHWVAQRRFEAVPLETESGALFPCLGVYTIDGEAAGVYARVAAQALIDWRAQDAAVLIAADEPALVGARP